MKLDIDLIREILLAVESATNGVTSFDIPDPSDEHGKRFSLGGEYQSVGTGVLIYHTKLLVDKGLIYGVLGVSNAEHSREEVKRSSAPKRISVYGLTWEGHVFLDGTRNSGQWQKIKNAVKDFSVTTAISAISKIASDQVASLTAELTGLIKQG